MSGKVSYSKASSVYNTPEFSRQTQMYCWKKQENKIETFFEPFQPQCKFQILELALTLRDRTQRYSRFPFQYAWAANVRISRKCSKRLTTVVHHSNSSSLWWCFVAVFLPTCSSSSSWVLRSSDVGCMAIVQQVGVHGQEGGGGQVWSRLSEPRSRTSCRSPRGIPAAPARSPTIPHRSSTSYDEFHDIFRCLLASQEFLLIRIKTKWWKQNH